MTYDISPLLNLDANEKLRIISVLEASLQTPASLMPTTEQIDEIRRRREAYLHDPSAVLDWDDIERSLDAEHD